MIKPFEKSLIDANAAVRFVFQPAEEGGAGGKAMVEQGATENVFAAFMLHVNSATDTGMISSRPGVMLASSATFNVTITGLGGHAARPH